MNLPNVQFTEEQKQFRQEVRSFLKQHIENGTFETRCDSWLSGSDPSFSKLVAEQGWIGMTWPKQYGGSERSTIDRYILTEEFLAFGAPVAAHWFADRQTGPLLLRFGTDYQKEFFLPKIVKGEYFFAIGLSEPNSGSDLASVATRAEKVEGGWIVNGAKTWSSNAHDAHYMVTLIRTEPLGEKKHEGLSQFIIDLKGEGVTIAPIRYLTGEPHFNDIYLDNVFVPDEMVVGTLGNGWKQGLAELAFERSGPERILSTFPLLNEVIEQLKIKRDLVGLEEATKLVAELWSLRNLSIGVAKVLEEGGEVAVPAALVKSIGTKFEQKIPEIIRLMLDVYPNLHSDNRVERYLAESILHAPGFTIRGGTSEVLYGILAKGVIAQ